MLWIYISIHFYNHLSFFFFNDTATTEIYTLSLHDALPISENVRRILLSRMRYFIYYRVTSETVEVLRSEEHTSELQSLAYLVCRLLLEKKKETTHMTINNYKEKQYNYKILINY